MFYSKIGIILRTFSPQQLTDIDHILEYYSRNKADLLTFLETCLFWLMNLFL
jgi:hypothetical protein